MAAYQNVLPFLPNVTNNNSAFDFNIDVDEIKDTDPKAPHPTCNVTLKPHQLSLLYRAIQYENGKQKLIDFPSMQDGVMNGDEHFFHTNIGIIADRVGSGKSFVILSLITANTIMDRDTTMIKSSGLNHLTFHFKDTRRSIRTNVIVIPHNLALQWDQYIKRFGTIDKYKMINKNKVFDAFVCDEDNIESYDLVVVTSSFFNKFVSLYNERGVRFQRLIFDEVDTLNITGCQTVQANFIWFVTASYGNVLYPRGYSRYSHTVSSYIWCANGIRNSGFVKNIFVDLYMNLPRELVKVLVLKNAESYIEMSLNLPEIVLHTIKCRTPYAINILHGIVDKNVIEYLNAGDMQAAISYINPRNKGTQENLIDILIEKLNRQCKNFELQLAMCDELVYEDERDQQSEKHNLTTRIADIKTKIRHISDRIHESNVCPICYEDIDNQTITQCCQNSFCFKCIHMWLGTGKDWCPLCKHQLTSKMLYVVQESGGPSNAVVPSSEEDEDVLSEKFDKLKNLENLLKIKRDQNSKILIFSSYESSFQQIIPIMNAMRIRWEFIKGNGDQVNAIVRRYKSNETDVLLVNTRNYGVGMNLENTTDIIMFHKFDTQLDAQVIGRAHRMGRTMPLNVYYLLHENEISSVS